MQSKTNCPLCNSKKLEEIEVREMMFGTGDIFTYKHCENCGCLFLENELKSEPSYYPENYYSLNKKLSKDFYIKRIVKTIRLILSKNDLIFNLFSSKLPQHLVWLRVLDVSYKSKVLDIGCGNGDLLHKMYNEGFTNLYGIDPFTTNTLNDENIKIEKCILEDYTEKDFDFIMINHVLEHLDDHENILRIVKEKLNDNGILLVRTPIVNNSYDIYREHWAEIDAPRHNLIHSEKSFLILIRKVGLQLTKKLYDTTLFEFLASEQYKNGISLFDNKSYTNGLEKSIFSVRDIKQYEKKIKQYNKLGLAGRGCYFLRK